MRPVAPQRVNKGGESSFPFDYEETTVPSGSVWLRLTRVGGEFTGYFSDDGKAWTKFCGETRSDLAGPVYVGLATAATEGERGTEVRYEECSVRSRG
jgi:regulation of enolase protein 1 (concanavalin A-like superfamily)